MPQHQATTKLSKASILDRFPPTGLILLAIFAIQIGAGLAVFLFPFLGAEGTASLRIIFSAIILSVAARGQIFSFRQIFQQNWLLLIAYGISIATMSFFFYKALALIPLGAVMAIEFIGPLGLSAITARQPLHFLWVAIAAIGVCLLSPFSGADLNPLGVLFAFLASTGWTSFIILSKKIGQRVPGNDGLAIAMIIAAIIMFPTFVPLTGILLTKPLLFLAGLMIALLATTIPFTLEFNALKRLPTRAYGVLISLEPAVAAIVGVVLLKEHIGFRGITAVICVVIAAVGMALSEKKSTFES